MVAKFWMLYEAEVGAGVLKERYCAKEEAGVAAERLVRGRGGIVYILEAIERCSTKEPPVQWEATVDDARDTEKGEK